MSHASFAKRSIVCTRRELGIEHSIVQYVTFTLDVCQVCHCADVGWCVKTWVLLCRAWSYRQWAVTLLRYLEQMSASIELVTDDNFMTVLSFSQTSHLRTVRATQSDCRSPKLSIIFSPELRSPTAQRWSPLITRFTKSYHCDYELSVIKTEEIKQRLVEVWQCSNTAFLRFLCFRVCQVVQKH